jgi:hypothetical protein
LSLVFRFLADENFDNDIVRGLLRRHPDLDLVRVQDVGLAAIDDPTILAWAADDNRILLTHDVATVTHFTYERLTRGEAVPGVIEVGHRVSVGRAIEDLSLIVEGSHPDEWRDRISYLPL